MECRHQNWLLLSCGNVDPAGCKKVIYDSPLLLPNIPEACLKSFCLMTSIDDVTCVSTIIDYTKYSSLHKLFRATAYVLQFITRLKGQDHSNELTQNDLAKARVLWILESQTTLAKDNNFSMWKCSRRHWITTLIVQDAHCTVKHNGIKETLSQIQSQYNWIVGGRSLV